MNKFFTSKLSFISFVIALYFSFSITALAVLLIPISKNFLSFSLTYPKNLFADSIGLFVSEIFLYLIILLGPIFIHKIIARKELKLTNSAFGNLIVILIIFLMISFNFKSVSDLFYVKSSDYFYYELTGLSSNKFSFWDLKDYYHFDNNKIVSLFYQLSLLILLFEFLFFFVSCPLKTLNAKLSVSGNIQITYYHLINSFILTVILCFALLPNAKFLNEESDQFANNNSTKNNIETSKSSSSKVLTECECTEQNAKELAWSFVQDYKNTHDPYAPVDEWTNLEFSRIEKGANCTFLAYFDLQSNDKYSMVQHEEIKKRIFCDMGKVSF